MPRTGVPRATHMNELSFNIPLAKTCVRNMKMGSWFKVRPERLEEQGINLRPPGLVVQYVIHYSTVPFWAGQKIYIFIKWIKCRRQLSNTKVKLELY